MSDPFDVDELRKNPPTDPVPGAYPQVVWKFPVPLRGDAFHLELPATAAVLDLQVQDGVPCLWVQLRPDHDKVRRTFRWIATGQQEIGFFDGHIGTVQVPPMVWHLYQIREYGAPTWSP